MNLKFVIFDCAETSYETSTEIDWINSLRLEQKEHSQSISTKRAYIISEIDYSGEKAP